MRRFCLAFALIAPGLGKEPPVVVLEESEQHNVSALERHGVQNHGQALTGIVRIGSPDALILDFPAGTATFGGIGDEDGIIGHT